MQRCLMVNTLQVFFLFSSLFSLSSGRPVSANSNSIVVHRTGCGTGCSISQKQLGVPYQDKMGIRKVLVQQTYELYTAAGSYGGKDRTEVVRKYFLAHCEKRKANFTSYSSNGSGDDDIFRWVDVPHGSEKTREFGPGFATYVQFDRICALRLPVK